MGRARGQLEWKGHHGNQVLVDVDVDQAGPEPKALGPFATGAAEEMQYPKDVGKVSPMKDHGTTVSSTTVDVAAPTILRLATQGWVG